MSTVLNRLENRRVLAGLILFCGLAGLSGLAPLRAQPASPAWGRNFPMYISSLAEKTIYKIDSTGNKTVLTSGGYLDFGDGFLAGQQELGDLAVDRAGNVYATSDVGDGSSLHQIVKVDPLGNQSIFAVGGSLGRTWAIAFDPAGNLMVANGVSGDRNILRIAPDGTQSVFAQADNDLYGTIRTLAFDDSGLLYGIGWISDGVTGNRIWKIPAGGPLVAYSSAVVPDRVPYAMAFGSWPHSGLNSGALLVSEVDVDSTMSWLRSFDGTGATGEFSGAGLPTMIAFGPGGDLYLSMSTVADCLGLYKGDSSGNLTLFSGLSEYPGAIAFTPDAAGYNFSGFDRPVDAPPAVNTGRAGQAFPLKWQLTDQAGEVVSSLDAISSITYQTADCAEPDVATSLPMTATPKGRSGLKFDNKKGEFKFEWESPKTPGCYKLSLALDSGQVFTAQFKLKK